MSVDRCFAVVSGVPCERPPAVIVLYRNSADETEFEQPLCAVHAKQWSAHVGGVTSGDGDRIVEVDGQHVQSIVERYVNAAVEQLLDRDRAREEVGDDD